MFTRVSAEIPERGPISSAIAPGQLDGETTIWQIVQTAGGQIIAGGSRIGFEHEGRFEFLPLPRKEALRSLLVDGNTLWVASLGEIGKLTLPLNHASRYEKLDSPSLASAGEFWSLAKVGDTLVATTKEDVWLINPHTKDSHRINIPSRFRLLPVMWDHKLVISKPNGALWIVNGDRVESLENPLPNKLDTAWLWSDSHHILTVSALYRKENETYLHVTDIKDLNLAVITSVVSWGKFIAVATYTKGLALIDPDSGKIDFVTRATGLPTLGITSLFTDKDGHLWVGTNQGIVVFESLRFGHRIAARDYPLTAARTEDGFLIGYENRTDYFHNDGLEEHLDRSYTLAQTARGTAIGFWGKLRIGAQEFSLQGNKVDYVESLPNGDVLTAVGEQLYVVDAAGKAELVQKQIGEVSGLALADGQLWAATFDGALYRAEPTRPYAFARVATLPGGTGAKLHALGKTLIVASADGVRFGEQFTEVAHTAGVRQPRLARSSSDLWLVAEQDGAHRLGRLVPSDRGVSWETVEAKGLAALPDVHYFSASGDTLTFCGGNTVLELDARELTPAYRLDPPRLAFSIGGEKSSADSALATVPEKISADQNRLTFTGALPADEFGEKPGYERRLLPTETAWIPAKAGEPVSYPSLAPARYTLEVRATHLGRRGAVVSQTFTVLPPWYASPGAFIGYGAFALLSSYGIFRFRTHQIRKRNLELERLVEKRTHELAQASAAKTEFLASMSHEIRNPMNGVIGLVNILREEPPGPRQKHMFRKLAGCAEQLRTTVDDILDFSKIEAGKVELERRQFDLLDTLEAAAATIDPGETKIKFLEPKPPSLALVGDAGKLRQIFANYLSNALKYGLPPEARVNTILVPHDDGVRLTLSVTSSGPTIAKDTLDSFFESFARGADAMERNIHGTGLGLAICKRYAQAMGGEVGAVSTNGETTFYLNVPFAKADATDLAPFATPEISALPAKALAIEDEDYNRIVLGNILAKMNYSVDWATTGAEALKLAQENGYDIVLTDYRLPDTNGVDLAREILRLCPEPKPAVFAVTAYSTRERKEECLRAGMSGFISKPITLEKLRDTLAGWGDRQLTTISLEASRQRLPAQTPAALEAGWADVKRAAMFDTKRAAELAHRLIRICRAFGYTDLAEQMEMLEGVLERGEPAEPFLAACERLLHPEPVEKN